MGSPTASRCCSPRSPRRWGSRVAKLSGRGLGHTGGTLDKLESIPGLRTDLSPEDIRRQVEEVGCAVAAQSPNLVPADGALYALRDATATVPSIPLIAASVMSKKLAVETDLILLDVKTGSGAFMKTPEDARALAERCLALAAGWGRSRQRGRDGHVAAARGRGRQRAGHRRDGRRAQGGGRRPPARGGAAVRGSGVGAHARGCAHEEALAQAAAAIASGEALERFRRMVEAQGGDPGVVDDPAGVLPAAPVREPLVADRDGVLAAVEAEEIGLASVDLGAGRRRKGDPIDPAVGIVVHPKIGDRLEAGQPIGEVHARDRDAAAEAARRVLAAMDVADGPVAPPPLVHAWM